MTYKHGVYISEQPTSIVPPRTISAALPVVFGTAPINMVAGAEANVPVLASTYQEAVAALGWSEDWASFTLCEFMDAFFGKFGVGPAVFVNVLNATDHSATEAAEAQTFADDEITLDYEGVIQSTIVIKDATDTDTYLIDDDYTVAFDDDGNTVISRVSTGDIGETDTVHVTYDRLDPSTVVADDIVGGVDGATGVKTGLELVDDVFPRFRLIPGQIVAPGWSDDSAVAATMATKAGNINSHFKAICLVDLDDTTATIYSGAPTEKNTNSMTDEQMVVCWPKVKLGTKTYHMSSQVAGLIAQVDADNDDIPYASPSNHNLKMDTAVADDEEVWLGPTEANYLNGQGIITALNFMGGWKCWGSRTGAYPDVTDVKDSFLPVRRMFNWIGNTLVTTFWQKTDAPITRRLIETIVDSVNIWLNGLAARQYILGGRVEFSDAENAVTDLMDGIIRFHVYVTPPSPAREIDFIVEYDPDYLSALFG